MAGLGVDGCRGGWIYFRLDAGETTYGVVRALAEIVAHSSEGDLILADVPIGLLEDGPDERACDLEARRRLSPGGRGSSVFPVPCRAAVYAGSYDEASRLNEERTGRRLSKQSWAITPGIREADELMRTSDPARARLREAHPEVLFWALAGRPMTHSKKTQEGLLERVGLLEDAWPGTEELAAAAFVEHGGYRVDRHDVVDALAAALSASRPEALASLPENPPKDAFGIPMEMVYPRLSS
jgi:predicted RNase H-like nuclease